MGKGKYLKHYLEEETKTYLIDLCKHYKFKGYSSKKKEELIELINANVFEDDKVADQIFEGVSVEFYNVLNHLIISDNLCTPYEGNVTPFQLIFERDGNVCMPVDVKEYIRNYVIEKSQSEGQEDEVIALVSAVNLYGYFSLQQYQHILEKFLNVTTTVEEIEADLSAVATVRDGFVLNPLLQESSFEMPTDAQSKKYYTPDTWDEFKKYFNIDYYVPTKATKDAFDWLSQYIIDEEDTKSVQDSLLVAMKTADHPVKVINIVEEMERDGVINEVDHAVMTEKILVASRNVRNWHLGGFTKAEQEMINQPFVINKRVVKKSKKRRKNNNVNRFRK